MSYLDDADHSWELDDVVAPKVTFQQALAGLGDMWLDPAGFDLVVRGYLGLRERHPSAPPAQCLETSLIWYFG